MKVPGASVETDFISSEQEKALSDEIESWAVYGSAHSSIGRHVIWWGPQQPHIVPVGEMAPAPDSFFVDERFRENPSVLANIYEPGSYITAHIDNPFFGEPIYVLSLLSDATMVFTCAHGRNQGRDVPIELPRRSLLTLQHDARHKWQHAIHEMDTRRMSLVYRRPR